MSAEKKEKLQPLSVPVTKRESQLLNSIAKLKAAGKGETDEKDRRPDSKTPDAAKPAPHVNEQAFKVEAGK